MGTKIKGTILSLLLASSSLSFAQNKENVQRDDQSSPKTEQTTPNLAASSSHKHIFSGKELAKAYKAAGIESALSENFVAAYMDKLDENGAISAKDLAFVVNDFCHSDEQKSKFINNLMQDKQDSQYGYNYGSGTISFSINNNGEIARLVQNGKSPNQSQHIDEINEAMSRHNGIAVDRMENSIEASMFITKMQVRDIIKTKQANGEMVMNGDKFLLSFSQDLAKNGLEIGKDGRLHGIEASKNKPLKTEKDLFTEFSHQQDAQYKDFRNQGR